MSEQTPETLQIILVPLAEAVLWDDNPKLHDLGAMATSFRKHGFRDAPIFDGTLGQITAGNGRIETLRWMKSQGETNPRGILLRDDGEWLVPVQVGMDSSNEAQARAFAVDHNNLTLLGGAFTLYDIAKIWDDTYPERVAAWAADGSDFASLDGDDIDALAKLSLQFEQQLEDDGGEIDPNGTHRLVIQVADPAFFEECVDAVRDLVGEHPEWKAEVK